MRWRQEHAEQRYKKSKGNGAGFEGDTTLIKLSPYDPVELLDSEEMIEEYLLAVCEDGTASEIARALGDIARARGITDLARKTGLTRQTLYKALSGEGNPELATITKVAEALGFRLSFVRISKGHQDAA
jgi:probable addiction module antidote protein